MPPELREDRGEIEAAAHRTLPRLIDRADLRGDLHMHTHRDRRQETTCGDGGGGARRQVSSTSPSPITASRSRWPTGLTNSGRSRTRPASARSTATHGVRLLAGIECDIRADGSLDLADDCLAALDIVVASVHSAFNQDRQQMTDRLLRAHREPACRRHRPPDRPPDAAARAVSVRHRGGLRRGGARGVALEINSQVDRLDLNDVHARLARDRGVPLVISSDAHSQNALGVAAMGRVVARRAWLEPGDVLNTRPFEDFRSRLRRNQR